MTALAVRVSMTVGELWSVVVVVAVVVALATLVAREAYATRRRNR